MNIDNVRLWVEDLERNQHPQTRGVLCELDAEGEVVGYCVNGRACEVAIAHGLPLKARPLHDWSRRCRLYNGCGARLPDAVERWLGVDVTDLRDFGSVGVFYSGLSGMNDSGATFPELAQYIREHVAGL